MNLTPAPSVVLWMMQTRTIEGVNPGGASFASNFERGQWIEWGIVCWILLAPFVWGNSRNNDHQNVPTSPNQAEGHDASSLSMEQIPNQSQVVKNILDESVLLCQIRWWNIKPKNTQLCWVDWCESSFMCQIAQSWFFSCLLSSFPHTWGCWRCWCGKVTHP